VGGSKKREVDNPRDPVMDLHRVSPALCEELLLARRACASPALSLPLESRERAFESFPAPRAHTYGRTAPQPSMNREEPDPPGRMAPRELEP